MELNDSEVGEISNDKLKRTMIRIVNKIKQEMNKHLNEQRDCKKQLNKIRKAMQDMTEEF
jgi:hypothetical protein